MSASDLSAREGRSTALRLGAALACAVLALPAWAQSAASREQELIRRLRQQVQQLQAEQGTQQQAAQRANAEKTEAQTRLDAATANLRRAQQAAAARAQGADEAQQALEALRQAHATLEQEAQALKSELQVREQSLATLRTEHQALQRTLAQRGDMLANLQARGLTQAQGLQSCIANNQALHGLGLELLQAWQDKGVVATTAQVEPFFQFNRVKIENLVQGYQDKLDQQLLKAARPEPGRAP